MGVRKFRSVEEMKGQPPLRPLDPENLRIACALSSLERLAPVHRSSGVRKFWSIEDMSRSSRRWTAALASEFRRSTSTRFQGRSRQTLHVHRGCAPPQRLISTVSKPPAEGRYCTNGHLTSPARRGMQPIDKRNLVAQWAFDTRPVLLRFHLWLEDVEVERAQPEPVSAHAFAPRGIARCLAITSAATALGTRLFGGFGEGAGKDKPTLNQVKKAADAISAYVMSEGLWHLTRTLPENHAIMVCLGEGLMPKAGETPEMGANPLLGFGRVYARPEVARIVDRRVRRLLNEPGHTFEQFYGWMQERGITIWGAAVDTLENTSRFAEGKETGPDGRSSTSSTRRSSCRARTSRTWAASRCRGAWPRRPTALAAARLPDAARAGGRRRSSRPTPASGARTSTSGRCGARAAPGGSESCGRSGRRWASTSSRRAGRPRQASRCSPTRARTRRRSSSGAGRTPRETRTSSSATATPPRPRRCRRPASPRCWTSTPRWRSSPRASTSLQHRGQAHAARPRQARLRAESLRGAGRAGRRRGPVGSYAAAIREAKASNLPTGRPVLRPDDFLPAEELARAGVDRLHLRRPLHRNGRASRASATASTG